MSQRIAAKWTAAGLGLASLLLMASHAPAVVKTAPRAKNGPVAVKSIPRSTAPKAPVSVKSTKPAPVAVQPAPKKVTPSSKASDSSQPSKWSKPTRTERRNIVRRPGGAKPAPGYEAIYNKKASGRMFLPGNRARTLTKNGRLANTRSFAQHWMGVPLMGQPLTEGGSQYIDVRWVGDDAQNYVYAAGGIPEDGGVYPNTDPDLEKQALKEPDFLVGQDFMIDYTGAPFINFLDEDDEGRGEFFEPSPGRGRRDSERRLFFSGFWKGDSDIYQPDINGIDFDEPGPAVRVISYSDDALNPDRDPDNQGTVGKTLQPGFYGVGSRPTLEEDDGGDGGDGTGASTGPKFAEGDPVFFPMLAPDASPTVYPQNSRFVVFVSLRGYNPKNPNTHYTSLWVWDTAKEPDDAGYVRQVYSVSGKSILFPRFSPDGNWLAWTETDYAFPPISYTTAAGQTIPDIAPDPVYDFTVTRAALAKPFTAEVKAAQFRMWLSKSNDIGVPQMMSDPFPVGNFTDEAGTKSREMMPFFSELNQIGFSSDRIDVDNDGYADVVPTDPAAAKWTVYTFPYPIQLPPVGPPPPPPYEDVLNPDRTPMRLTGYPDEPDGTDDFNELNADWAPAPLDRFGIVSNSSLGMLSASVLYQSDAAGSNDLLFVTNAFEANPNGNITIGIPEVTPKEGMPGEPVTITMKIKPDYLVRDPLSEDNALKSRVWALIKDPDNRLYDTSYGLLVENWKTGNIEPTAVNDNVQTMIFREADQQPVTYTAEDLAAYLERYMDAENPPQYGPLVELFETEPGSGIFTGQWHSPMEVSDFLIDVFVFNDPTSPIGQLFLSDNIQGFTTAPFVPYGPYLLVSDFAHGQKAVPYTTRTPSAAAIPAESFFTEHGHSWWASPPGNPSDGKPIVGEEPARFLYWWNPMGPRVEWQTATAVVDPVKGYLVPSDDSVPNFNNPMQSGSLAASYDLWRTQCRNPITYDVLNQYKPYMISEPSWPDPRIRRDIRVVDRAVLWFAPHAGQLNGNAGTNAVGFGTIANPVTQPHITRFVNEGGRMLLTGSDVAFALTQDGRASSAAPGSQLLKAFRVAYLGTEIGHYATDLKGQYDFARTRPSATGGEVPGINFIPWDVGTADDHFPQDTVPNSLALAPFYSPFGTYPQGIVVPIGDANQGASREDGAMTNLFIDAIVPVDPTMPDGGTAIYSYNDGEIGEGVAAVQVRTPVTATINTSVKRSLYFAFGLEGVDRQYTSAGGDAHFDPGHYHVQSPLSMIMHNVGDFFFTGSIAGTVYVSTNLEPVNDVIVRAYDDRIVGLAGTLMSTTVTGPTAQNPDRGKGRYLLQGLDPSLYELKVYKTGYVFQNPARIDVEGFMTTPNINLYLIPVPPGNLTVTVRDKENNAILPGVTVTVIDIQQTISRTGVTDASGRVTFADLPAGEYIAIIPATTVGDQAYDAFESPTPFTVLSSTDNQTTVQLIRKTVDPGEATVTGLVQDQDGAGIESALVSLLDSTGALVPTLDLGDNPILTAPDGSYTFVVPSGTYTVKAEVEGYKAQTRVITASANNNPNVVQTFVFGGVLHTFPADKVVMASAPYDYSAIKFDVALNLTPTQLTGAIVAYNPTSASFIPYPNFPVDTFRLGKGYGMKLPAEGQVRDEGNPPTLATDGTFTIRAETGWNLIGNPFTGPVLWSSEDPNARAVKVMLVGDSTGTRLTMPEAMRQGIVISPLWGGYNVVNGTYVGTYQTTDRLMPWESKWIKVSRPVVFVVPRPTGLTSLVGPSERAERRGIQPVVDQWGLNITATQGTLVDDDLALGVSTRGTTAVDAGMDFAKPTPLTEDSPMLYTTLQQKVGREIANFATDIRAVQTRTHWMFTVKSNQPGKQVTLTWSPVGSLPAGATVTLTDTVSGKRINMSASSAYAYTVGSGSETRTFRVEVLRRGPR